MEIGRPRARVVRKLRSSGHVAEWWTEWYVGDDELGQWAILPAGGPVHRDSGTTLRYTANQAFCYPRESWWVARFGLPPVGFRAIRAGGTLVERPDIEPERAMAERRGAFDGRAAGLLTAPSLQSLPPTFRSVPSSRTTGGEAAR